MACCYVGCNNTRKRNPNLTFFRFPKEKERRYLWMKECNNASIENFSFEELQNRVVCEAHFLPKCFDYSVLTSGKTRRSLFKFALPQPASVIAALKQDEEKTKSVEPPQPPLLSEPPLSQTSLGMGQSRHKDLVSPQRLMNITENMCPLLRPISPTLTDSEDDNYLNFPEISAVSEVSCEADSYGEESECEESEEEKENEELPSSSPSHILSSDRAALSPLINTAPSICLKEEINSISSAIYLQESVLSDQETITAKEPSASPEDPSSCMETSKRPLDSPLVKTNNFKVEGTERTRKYKRILPKNSYLNGGEVQDVFRAGGDNITNDSSRVPCSSPLLKDDEEPEEVVLNLSGMGIQKMDKIQKGSPDSLATTLYLDNNFIQTLPTIDSYRKLKYLSLANNKIDSWIWFGSLSSLRVLNVSGNKITEIKGLWKLCHLTHVNLSGNLIEVLRVQSNKLNSKLEFLDVSNNKVYLVQDLSTLTCLKELRLHRNYIKSISPRKCKLPESLVKLTLARNAIPSLKDVSHLSILGRLKELSLKQNPCFNDLQLIDSQNKPLGAPRSFDYRLFVAACCPSLELLDDVPITEEEKTKARWLLTQKQFRDENHPSLVTYLSEVCPLPSPLQEPTDSSYLGQVKFPLQKEKQNSSLVLPSPATAESLPMPSIQSSAFPPSNLPFPNESSSVDGSERKTSKSYAKVAQKHELSRTYGSDCSWNEGPCKHYIELIEEKAKNHKLLRKNEELQLQIEDLAQRVQSLEVTLAQNDINYGDMVVKIEMEEDTVDS